MNLGSFWREIGHDGWWRYRGLSLLKFSVMSCVKPTDSAVWSKQRAGECCGSFPNNWSQHWNWCLLSATQHEASWEMRWDSTNKIILDLSSNFTRLDKVTWTYDKRKEQKLNSELHHSSPCLGLILLIMFAPRWRKEREEYNNIFFLS